MILWKQSGFSAKLTAMDGRVAQLVEHYLDMVVVTGSSPVVATIFIP